MKKAERKFILLFNPQPVAVGRTVMPLSLLAISTFLDKNGYNIKICHSSQKKEYESILERIDDAICVGITSMTGYQITDGLRFARLVRNRSKNIPIVWGGIHPTIETAQTIRHPLVDIVVRGQGEETFCELVKALEVKADLKSVRGIVYKIDGKVIENAHRPIRDMNEFPPMPYHILGENIERYIIKTNYSRRTLPIITSSGCPFRCGFCYLSTPEYIRKWDAYPSERIVAEIEFLIDKYKIDGVDVRDSNFFVDKQRAKNFFSAIVEKDIKISFVNINGRVDQLANCDDDFWELMRRAGVKDLLIGAESGDQEMLDLINKKITPEITLECIRKAKKHNVSPVVSLLTNFPPTTDDPKLTEQVLKRELNNTAELARKILKINPLVSIMLFSFTPYPGTPLYQLCLKRGFKAPESLEDWGRIDLNTQSIPWVSDGHMKKVELLNDIFVLLKITSAEYFRLKKDKRCIHYVLRYSGIYKLVNLLVLFRLKFKFFFFPIERLLFSVSMILYGRSRIVDFFRNLIKKEDKKRAMNC